MLVLQTRVTLSVQDTQTLHDGSGVFPDLALSPYFVGFLAWLFMRAFSQKLA